ncbi:MAG: DUF2779 domain-containing protein [Ruminococcaceae bacterium]|nr:DUF2779 domain-containing protein [Oscillospiraceae bacterium]
MNLSKSKYCLLWQCPKLLWLDTYHKELRTENPALAERMVVGNEVGDLAMGLFGDYTEVTVMKDDGRPDIPAMIEKTRQCIENGVENICEASFSYDGLYCAVDILRREDGGYAIYEVKSSTHASDIYGVDISYQKYVLEHCGITVTGTYLVHINSGYVRGEELDIRRLFQIVDMSELVAEKTPQLPMRLQLAEKLLALKDEPTLDIGMHCEDPYHCDYWEYCTRHLPTPSVFDLYRMTTAKKFKYYRQQKVSYQDLLAVPDLNEKQLRQIQFHLTGCGAYIDKAGIQAFLNTLSYPLYFLDFETMQPAIPLYEGTKPYAQIPFQYSLHYIEVPGGELKHKEFLAESGTDPRRVIAESLCRDIPMHTCVTAYNKSFECSRLKELAQQFPDLASHLLNIQENIRDLLVPFQSGHYYNRAMGGSFSIKSVLPALFPNDPVLDYHNLECVHNGAEAMTIFPKIKDMYPEDQSAARASLLAYCKLDTYAMVKVWEALEEAVK